MTRSWQRNMSFVFWGDLTLLFNPFVYVRSAMYDINIMASRGGVILFRGSRIIARSLKSSSVAGKASY